MIEDIEEGEYRALPEDSSSSLKEYSVDKRKYRKRYILKEHVEEKFNEAAEMGRLVETILMEPERFDDMFYMSACATVPGGLMGEFIDDLVKETLKSIDIETGAVTEDFLDIAERAYEISAFKIKFPAVMKKFDGTEAEIYYHECVKVKYNKLRVVTPNMINNAEKIVKELQESSISSTIVNLKTGPRFEVQNQIKISGFSIDGLPLKAMLDKVIIDHTAKTIQIYDLKCTWNVEKFYKEYYLFRKAYIQGFVYFKAVESLTVGPDAKYPGYKTLLPKFLVCDSINYYSPLIFEMSEDDLQEAYYGFSSRGYEYSGVKDVISNLIWSKENDLWNISRENWDNDGLVKLKH